jgi:hypothetical protein
VRTRRLLVIISGLLAVPLAVQVAGAGGHDDRSGAAGARTEVRPPGGGQDYGAAQRLDYTLKPCEERFAQFHVGSSFQGHPLNNHTRFCTRPDPERSVAAGGDLDGDSLGRSNFDSYLYGSCEAGPGEACSPPLEIQSWPACERSAADYNAGPPGQAKRIEPIEAFRVRGVPARLYEDMSLELSTKAVTVVIYGHSREQLLSAARELRTEEGAPFHAAPQQELPPPAAGAEDGTLSC